MKEIKYNDKKIPPDIQAQLDALKGKNIFSMSQKEKDLLLYALLLRENVIDKNGVLLK